MEQRKPNWLKVKFENPKNINKVEKLLENLSLNTVCKEANCPNKMECYNKGTATFMILGSICSRNCKFCNVTKGDTEQVDSQEPENLGKATKELNLNHVVITSVTRDDLVDGGASQFAKSIEYVHQYAPNTSVEVLIPDFKGNEEALLTVVKSGPEILNHNVETVPRLYETVRPMANYKQSLKVLEDTKKMNSQIYTKSGIMLGLGEREEEVVRLMYDLLDVGCDFMTIGQYLRPSEAHIPVVEYVHPDIFKMYEKIGLEMGFKHVASGPFVRSSYNAELVKDIMVNNRP